MHREIDRIVSEFTRGRIGRRQLIAALAALVAFAATPARVFADDEDEGDEHDEESTFRARGLDHIALRVRDVPRARDFYVKHLGMRVTRDGGERSCFLSFGYGFLALFRGDEARMDHYCYAVRDYDVERAAEKLRDAGLEPRIRGNRIYFDDPDGHVVQLAAGSLPPAR